MKVNLFTNKLTPQLTLRRAKLRLFTWLAIVWGMPALIGLFLLWRTISDDEFSSLNLLGWLLAVPEPLFIGLAVYFWRGEKAC